MDDKSKHIKLHTDSMIRLRALEHYLDKEKIPCLIKNLTESARLGGFGDLGVGNELYVYEEDKEASEKILKLFLSED